MTIRDKNIWESYTQGIKPVRKQKISVPKNDVKKSTPKISAPVFAPVRAPLAKENLESVALERKRERNLRQGKIEIEAKLDLHGMTQDEAFEALARFISKQVKTDKRHLLIVTGKGRAGEGVLRRNLKNWLGQLPEANFILALRPAAPQHGGDGAFYVILRKPKESMRF